MRRKYVVAVGLAAIMLVALVCWLRPDPHAPQFVPLQPGYQVPVSGHLGYEFLQLRPFEGGRMWVQKDRRCFLFDIEAKQVLGELTNGWPVFMNGDQSRLLVQMTGTTFREEALKFLEKITSGRFKLTGSYSQTFGVLDLKSNKTAHLGRIYQASGFNTTWSASPTFRYAYNRPTRNLGSSEIYFCDIESSKFTTFDVGGHPVGWWSDKEILVKTEQVDLVLYDVETGNSTVLLSSSRIEQFLEDIQFTEGPRQVVVSRFRANGDFYLVESGWFSKESAFLARIERDGGNLKLIDRHFRFGQSDSLHPSGQYYLFSSKDKNGRDTREFLVRDLTDGSTQALVQGQGEKPYGFPRWYGNTVIYIRSNMLWQISLTDTNPVCLFPPQ